MRREAHGRYNGTLTFFKDQGPALPLPPNAGVEKDAVRVVCPQGLLARASCLLDLSNQPVFPGRLKNASSGPGSKTCCKP